MRQPDRERTRVEEEKREGGREAANGSFCDTTRSRGGRERERRENSSPTRSDCKRLIERAGGH